MFRNSNNFLNCLFIAGCARSGTTALTRLLNSHPDIFVGTELFRTEFSSQSDLFNKDLFHGDRYQGKLAEMKESTSTLRYIGDKFPAYYRNYDFLFSRFDKAKIIFIVRNIFDVAQSYKARKIHPTNPWKKGVRRAVKEWNESLESTLIQLKKGRNIEVVCYENILFKPDHQLLNDLGLRADKSFDKSYKKIANNAKKLDAKRVNILDHNEKLTIMENARFDLYKELLTAINPA